MGADVLLWVEIDRGGPTYSAVRADWSFATPDERPLLSSWPFARDKTEFALLGHPGFSVVEPLVRPRGLPERMWPPTQQWCAASEFCHVSWLSVDDLLAIDWTAPVRYRSHQHPNQVGGRSSAAGTESDPIVDVDDSVFEKLGWSLQFDGAEGADGGAEFVVDIPLWRAAGGLRSLAHQMSLLRQRGSGARDVRAVYGFDQ